MVCTLQPALPGKLLCAVCKAYAKALEGQRLATTPINVKSEARTLRAAPRALAIVSVGVALACGPTASSPPCSASDHMGQAKLGVNVADCELRLKACPTIECVDKVEAECKDTGERICE